MTRQNARRAILRAANRASVRPQPPLPYHLANLNEAVCMVRRGRLVKPDVLVAAGFRPTERRR